MTTPEANTGGTSTLKHLARHLEESRVHKPLHGNYLGQGGEISRTDIPPYEAYFAGSSQAIRASFIAQHPETELYVPLGTLSVGFEQDGVAIEGYTDPSIDDIHKQFGLATLVKPFGSWLADAATTTTTGDTYVSKHQPRIEDLSARLAKLIITREIKELPSSVVYPTSQQVQPLVNFVLASQHAALYRRRIVGPGISGLDIRKVNSTVQPL